MDWARRGAYADGGNASTGARGTAVVSLDMIHVEGVDEVFVVRGLLSLSPEAAPLKRLLRTSAYGGGVKICL